MQKPNRAAVAPRRKSLANLLLVAPAFATMAGLSISAIWLIQQWQSLRCPAGTFLVGSGQGATAFQIIPILFASMGLGFLSVNWVVHLIPPLRDFFDRNARRHGESSYRRAQRALAKLSVIMLSIMLPISIAASFSQYCLAEREILYQAWPWTGLHQYSWQDVAAIETSCTRGTKGGWNPSLFLVTRDGASFDIMAWTGAAIRAYPDMARALASIDFAFSAKNVSPNCPRAYADLLTRRP